MKIKKVIESNKTELFSIHERCFKKDLSEILGWDDAWQWEYFCKMWERGEWRVLIEDAQVVGYLMWIVKPEYLYLKNICLIPEYQGKGLGSIAMAFIEEQAVKNNSAIQLSTFPNNLRAQKFYEKRGFKVIEVMETGHRMSND